MTPEPINISRADGAPELPLSKTLVSRQSPAGGETGEMIRLLLVEDDEDDSLITRGVLSEIAGCHYAVEWKDNFGDALDAWRSGAYDVCLLDYHLGPHTGLEFLRAASPREGEAPVILLTGLGDRDVDLEVMKAGAADFLSKRQLDPLLLERSIRYAMERKRSQDALHRQAEELARSNSELADFAYIASHDLKEPLRGIQNYAAFLMEDHYHKLEEDARARLDTIERLAKRLETLVDTLLHYSRVGRVDLAVGDTDLQAVLDQVIDSLHVSLASSGVRLEIPRPLPVVRCDRARVGEIFRNLITNAIKYNDKTQKWIQIGYWDEASPQNSHGSVGEGPVFFVKDNGIGIREKHQQAVFRIFKRLHGRDKYGGGSGAGLTVVKKVVERHGGRIWVESQFGEGSAFYFTLRKGEPNREQ